MEISNISRIGGGFHKALTLVAIVAVAACASGPRRSRSARAEGSASGIGQGPVPAPGTGEVYGPFPNENAATLPRPAAAAEMVANPDRVVLVFGRGLAHGYAYVGVLRALHELKVPVHAIYATEVGALASALHLAQPNPNRVDWALLRFTEKNLGPASGKLPFRLSSPEKDLEEKLREVFGDARIETFADRLRIELQDAKTGEALEARSGELWRALRGTLAGANGFDPAEFEGRSVRASARKLSEEYRVARQTEKYPIVVVSAGDPPTELFRKLIEDQRATLLYVPLVGIDDRDLKKRNQAVFYGKNAVFNAKTEILGLIGRKPE